MIYALDSLLFCKAALTCLGVLDNWSSCLACLSAHFWADGQLGRQGSWNNDQGQLSMCTLSLKFLNFSKV